MGSDRARISYNPAQQYRAVVAQQGRVTLEADWNEAQTIANEELREETLDFVGTCGTPDNGYDAIATGSSFDFFTTNGTMYVGGIKAYSPQDIQYSNQSDWLDYSTDPNWVEPTRPTNTTANELIYLLMREQEVSAVEDSALLEQALGGPDTTQRQRLIQHIVRLETGETTCSSALEEAISVWNQQGLQFDHATFQLRSTATLQVSFTPPSTPTDLCEPEAQSGYLGAANQLIRVQISGFDPSANQYQLVWGFDNAAFLYRVDIVNDQMLRLKSRPVDDFHNPRLDQSVEVLRSAAQLSNGEYIASATGHITNLMEPYNPDTREVSLVDTLSTEYLDTNQTPQLFVRVWEETTNLTPGIPILLGTTGLQVTLQSTNNRFHIGDYWQIAVRPGEPTEVYPHRYLEIPQPPNGPRLWICPLAIVNWNEAGELAKLEDCRNFFDNLVSLTKQQTGGCCTVVVNPGEDIQSALDLLPATGGCVCLKAGNHLIQQPIRLEKSNVVLQGESLGSYITGPKGMSLLVIAHPSEQEIENIIVERIQFETIEEGQDIDSPPINEGLIRLVKGAKITIQSCTIKDSLPESNVDIDNPESIGITLLDIHNSTISNNEIQDVVIGILLSESGVTSQTGGSRLWGNHFSNQFIGIRAQLGTELSPELEISDNHIENLQVAGIWVNFQSGTVSLLHNYIAYCGYFPQAAQQSLESPEPLNLGAGIICSSTLGHLNIESCTILNTGISKLGRVITDDAVLQGIGCRVQSCKISHNSFFYTDAERYDLIEPNLPHRALKIEKPRGSQASENLTITNNLFQGIGSPHLVEIGTPPIRGVERNRFSNIDFSHNQCFHQKAQHATFSNEAETLEEITEEVKRKIDRGESVTRTVSLFGQSLVVMGNQIQSAESNEFGNSEYQGETTVAIDFNPLTSPPVHYILIGNICRGVIINAVSSDVLADPLNIIRY